MALSITRLFAPVALGAAAATLFTNPASPISSVLRNGRVRFTNTTAGPVTVTAYAVPLAGTAAASNCFMNAESIAANSHLDIDVPMLAAGDFVQALASAAASITATALDGVGFS